MKSAAVVFQEVSYVSLCFDVLRRDVEHILEDTSCALRHSSIQWQLACVPAVLAERPTKHIYTLNCKHSISLHVTTHYKFLFLLTMYPSIPKAAVKTKSNNKTYKYATCKPTPNLSAQVVSSKMCSTSRLRTSKHSETYENS